MKIVVIQSSYIPWKGYFDLIGNADYCVFLDDVQFTKNDWRNRNRIKTREGSLRWLTIPVGQSISRKISEVALPSGDWALQHERVFREHYAHTPNFELASALLREHLNSGCETLSQLNQKFVRTITQRFTDSTVEFLQDTEVLGSWEGIDRLARLLEIVRVLQGTTYLSGPSARSYLDVGLFLRNSIEVFFASYEGYQSYPQGSLPFRHDVSILDAISWVGENVGDFLLRENLFPEARRTTR